MLEQIITGASAGTALALAVLLFALKMWADDRAAKRLDAYTTRLERRVVALEAALLAAGIPLPIVAGETPAEPVVNG